MVYLLCQIPVSVYFSGTPDKITHHRLSHYVDTLKDIVRNFPLTPLPFIRLTM